MDWGWRTADWGLGLRLAASLAVVTAVWALPAAAQTPFPSEPPKPGAPRDFRVPEPKRFTLDNGLQVALVPWGNMPKVRVTLDVRTGNAFEKASEVWLADLTGDLMREGTADAHRHRDLDRSRAHGRLARHRRRRRSDHDRRRRAERVRRRDRGARRRRGPQPEVPGVGARSAQGEPVARPGGRAEPAAAARARRSSARCSTATIPTDGCSRPTR